MHTHYVTINSDGSSYITPLQAHNVPPKPAGRPPQPCTCGSCRHFDAQQRERPQPYDEARELALYSKYRARVDVATNEADRKRAMDIAELIWAGIEDHRREQGRAAAARIGDWPKRGIVTAHNSVFDAK